MIAVIGMIIRTISTNSVCVASFDGKPSESIKIGQKGLTSVNRHGCVFGNVQIYPKTALDKDDKEDKEDKEDTDPLVGESPSSRSSDIFGNTRVEYSSGMILHFDSERNLRRIDGPAAEDDNFPVWYCHGKLHNKTGPADIDPHAGEAYALHGKELPKDVWEIARLSSPDCVEY